MVDSTLEYTHNYKMENNFLRNEKRDIEALYFALLKKKEEDNNEETRSYW